MQYTVSLHETYSKVSNNIENNTKSLQEKFDKVEKSKEEMLLEQLATRYAESSELL